MSAPMKVCRDRLRGCTSRSRVAAAGADKRRGGDVLLKQIVQLTWIRAMMIVAVEHNRKADLVHRGRAVLAVHCLAQVIQEDHANHEGQQGQRSDDLPYDPPRERT